MRRKRPQKKEINIYKFIYTWFKSLTYRGIRSDDMFILIFSIFIGFTIVFYMGSQADTALESSQSQESFADDVVSGDTSSTTPEPAAKSE